MTENRSRMDQERTWTGSGSGPELDNITLEQHWKNKEEFKAIQCNLIGFEGTQK